MDLESSRDSVLVTPVTDKTVSDKAASDPAVVDTAVIGGLANDRAVGDNLAHEQEDGDKPAGAAVDLPLCVDLDGTLLRTDMLAEGLFAAIGAADLRLPAALLAAFGSRAAFKRRVAEIAPFDPALLPYNRPLLARLRQEKAAGRMLVLATAADAAVARRVADHLGLFDAVIASDGVHNRKGAAKAEALVQRFGRRGFVYAGNDASDLPIWREAAAAIIVNAPPGVARQVRAMMPVEADIRDVDPPLRALLQAMRPHQWVKNLLALVPIITAHAVNDLAGWGRGALVCAALCLTASSIYLVNDLLDVAADRAHPRKRTRPFARGALRQSQGVAAAAVLLLAGLTMGWEAGALLIVAAYAAMSVGYSLRLKELPLVDVFMLAGLYTIRIVAGGEATGHKMSLWLLAFSSFLFLSLAFLKRVEEMMAAARIARGYVRPARRGYTTEDVPILGVFGVAAAFSAVLVLALFVQNETSGSLYASPALLWGIVPVMLLWLCRMWLSASRGYMHHDPIVYAARDWVSWTAGAVMLLVLMAAKSFTIFAG